MDKIAMVGEEVVTFSIKNNALHEGAGKIWPLKPNGYFQRRPHLSVIGEARGLVFA